MAGVPQTFRRLMVNQVSHKFRDVTSLVQVNTPKLKSNEMLVKNRFIGINASDVNFSAGRYGGDTTTPFVCGFEGLGRIVSKGEDVKLDLNQPVAYMVNGAFSEYIVVNQREAIPVPALDKRFLTLMVSGITAEISLRKIGEIKAGETVLVTAAAGGTGQFAVQLAKLAGCHVIGTCSSDSKAEMLKSMGCDRVINYNKEKLSSVLKTEYPRGVDVVYESVGGEMFDTAVNALAMHGRLIVIGWISGYQTDKGFNVSRVAASLPQRLLPKSASVRGFFLFGYPKEIKPAAKTLFGLATSGQLQCLTDSGEGTSNGPFIGLESIYDAVDYMYSKQNKGKIIVELPDNSSKM